MERESIIVVQTKVDAAKSQVYTSPRHITDQTDKKPITFFKLFKNSKGRPSIDRSINRTYLNVLPFTLPSSLWPRPPNMTKERCQVVHMSRRKYTKKGREKGADNPRLSLSLRSPLSNLQASLALSAFLQCGKNASLPCAGGEYK